MPVRCRGSTAADGRMARLGDARDAVRLDDEAGAVAAGALL